MAIYFPDGNGGRKVVDGFGGSNFSLAELKLTGFSEVASANGEITDEDNLLVALAKCWNRKAMPMTTVRTPSQNGTLTYNGTKQTPVWNGFDEEQLRIVSGNEATNAGSYKTTFALKTGCQWEDETMTNKDVEWKIGRAAIEKVPSQSNTLFYDGTPKAPAWRNYSSVQLTISGTTSGTAVGTYSVTFTPTANYCWADGSTAAKTVTWAIGRYVLDEVPTVASTLRYTGNAQSPTWNNYDSARLTIGGTTSAKEVGSYVATFTPKDGAAWSDGKSDTKSVTWKLERATVAVPSVTNTSFTYNGNNQSPMVGSYNSSLVLVTGNAPQVNVGTYSVVCSLKDKANYQWTDGTITDVSISWAIRKVSVAVPTVTNTSFTYNEVGHAPTISSYDTNAITVTGNGAQTGAGSYTVTFTLKNTTNYQWADGSTANKQVTWTIGKASVAVPSVSPTSFTYDTKSHVPTIGSYDSNVITVSGNTAQTNLGSYKLTFALKNSTNYQWTDKTTANKEVTWTIAQAAVAVPTVTNTSFTYDAKTHVPTISSYDTNLITVSGTTGAQTNAGSYTITFALKSTTASKWKDGTTANKQVTWTISKASVAIPSVTNTSFTYDTKTHAPTIGTYDTNLITVSGTTAAQTNAGTYTITFALKSTTSSQWKDSTTANKQVTWTINKASVAIPSVTNTSFTYNGSAHAPTVGSYDSNIVSVTGSASQTNAGTYTVVRSLKSTTNYQWSNGTTASVSTTWTINKATVAVPSVTNTTFTYDGNSHAPTIGTYDTNLITVSGTTAAQTNMGNYTITFALKSTTNYQWTDKTTANKQVAWQVKGITVTTNVPSQSNTLTYTGSAQSPTWTTYDTNQLTVGGTTSSTNAGTYNATFAPKGNYVWSDNTQTAKTVSWTIKRKAMTTGVPTQNGTLTYNGSEQSPKWNNYNTSQLTIDGETSATDSFNEYPYQVSFTPTANYCWSDGSQSSEIATWVIKRKKLTSTQSTFSQSGTLTYTCSSFGNAIDQKPTFSNFDETYHEYGYWAPSEWHAGTYRTEIYLRDPDNYTWSDGTDGSKEVEWTIKKRKISVPTATNKTLTYNYDWQGPTFTYDELYVELMITSSGGEVKLGIGTYETRFEIDINNCYWAGTNDQSTEDYKIIKWTINPLKVARPSVTPTRFTYDGNGHFPTIGDYEPSDIVVYSGNTQKEKGTYTITFRLRNSNLVWKDTGDTEDKKVTWTIV